MGNVSCDSTSLIPLAEGAYRLRPTYPIRLRDYALKLLRGKENKRRYHKGVVSISGVTKAQFIELRTEKALGSGHVFSAAGSHFSTAVELSVRLATDLKLLIPRRKWSEMTINLKMENSFSYPR